MRIVSRLSFGRLLLAVIVCSLSITGCATGPTGARARLGQQQDSLHAGFLTPDQDEVPPPGPHDRLAAYDINAPSGVCALVSEVDRDRLVPEQHFEELPSRGGAGAVCDVQPSTMSGGPWLGIVIQPVSALPSWSYEVTALTPTRTPEHQVPPAQRVPALGDQSLAVVDTVDPSGTLSSVVWRQSGFQLSLGYTSTRTTDERPALIRVAAKIHACCH